MSKLKTAIFYSKNTGTDNKLHKYICYVTKSS